MFTYSNTTCGDINYNYIYIDKNSNNLHVNIEVVNIPVFSSEDYVRSSFSKENASDFLEIYNKIINSLLNKKITANN